MKKLILVLCTLLCLVGCTDKPTPLPDEPDPNPLKEQYPEITGECVMIDASQEDIIAMLENGTGIVFFSWIDCPWCHGYIDMVNQAALDNGLTVLYYDIYNDRSENSEFYQKVISLISDYVDLFAYTADGESKAAYDSEGKPRIYVPYTVMVVKGKVIALDYQSSMESGFEENFEKFWNEEVAEGVTRRENTIAYFNDCFKTVKQEKDKIDEQGCDDNCKIG